MAKPTLVPETMKLYAPFCPDGRTFQKHADWPGDAWSVAADGKDDAESHAETVSELIAAHDEVARLEKVLASKDHDLGVMAKARDEAVVALEAQKQALLDAQSAKAEAESVATGLTKERDVARADLAKALAKIAKADA